MDLDEKDTQILKHLITDARQSGRQLAHRLGVSTVTMLSRIKKLEDKKIIQGYSVQLNHELLGYDITAIIEVNTTDGQMLKVENDIAKKENVIGVYDITGKSDTLVIAKFKDRKSLNDFIKNLSAIPNVENTVTNIVLNTIKEDNRII